MNGEPTNIHEKNSETASDKQAKKSTKLLFLVNDSAFFVSHRMVIARAAINAGYEVHLASLAAGSLNVIKASGVTFHPVSIDRTGLSVFSDVQFALQIWSVLRTVRPDILHAVTIKPVLYGGIMCRVLRIPSFIAAISGLGYVFQGESLKKRIVRAIVARMYQLAFAHPNVRVIFQNPDNMELFCGGTIVCPTKAVLIRGSGVDLSRFAPSPEPTGIPIVLLPARLLRAKGILEFVKAARALKGRGVRARFVIAGELAEHNRDSVLARDLEAWLDEALVEWWGHCEDMVEVFSRAAIVCLPSYAEGLPKALIEAAACAKPIIATDVPGCREIVSQGREGILIPPRDHKMLASAIERLLLSPADRTQMGRAARRRAEKEFDETLVVEQTLNLYLEVLTKARR